MKDLHSFIFRQIHIDYIIHIYLINWAYIKKGNAKINKILNFIINRQNTVLLN